MGENEKNYLDWEGLLEYHEKLETKLSEKANTEDLADVATSGDYNDLDNTPTNVSLFTNDAGYITSEIDNTNGHDYVEIGGIKWATMNIGAENITDIGLYFQWGDILGYTSEEVGEEKNFTWEDYKFNPSGDGTTFSKYNSTDLKTILDTEDDAAASAWGSDWRVPTTSELQTLSNAVNVSWTNDYEDSGVPGLILTDKEDSSKVLFLPATGVCNDGSIIDDDTTGFYWSKSLGNTDDKGLGLGFDKTNGTTWEYSNSRSLGFAIRPVLEGPTKRTILGVTQAEKDSWNSKISGIKIGESGNVNIPINGIVTLPNQEYNLPIASADTLGGVKVGDGLSIDNNGVLSTEGEFIEVVLTIGNSTTSVMSQKAVTDELDDKVDKTITVNGHTLSGNVTVSKSDVGLDNVSNDAQVKRSEMGANNGVATLDENGKVLSSQLPSYVDDVIEGYLYEGSFYKESTHETEITGESGKIYVDLVTNKTYRWSGSTFAIVSETLALGETSSTAYRGDHGKIAYDHSQLTSGNPHNVTKSDVGLGNVGNFKAVSTEASQGLSSEEQSNARANIGAGTSSFSGSYDDLTDKPTIPDAQIQSDWNLSDTNAKDFIKNKPTIPDALIQSDWNQSDNTSKDFIKNKPGVGVANGLATLDSSGKVPSSQLPSYVDDVIEGYYHGEEDPQSGEIIYNMYEDDEYTTLITPESGKIYLDIPSSNSYRWSGSQYVLIGAPYVLPTASENTLGGVKIGDNLSIDQNGVLSAESVEVVLTIGTSTTAVISQKGVTDIITENEEIVSNALTDLNDRVENLEENPYELPIASANTLGGVKIGDGIDITNNAISVKVGTNLSIDSSGNLNATDTTYSDATTSASGLMSAADKEKLNGIGTMGASGSSHSGGLVPDTPSTAGTTKFLCEDGTWKIPAGGGGSYLNEKEEVIAAAINDLNNNKLSNSRVRKTDFAIGDLQAAVEAQNLEMFGLKVGDSTIINGHKYVIAGLNAFKSTTFSKAVTLLKHVALIVIPGATQAWNVSGNTYTGANSYKSDSNVAGYLNSDLHYYLVNTVLPLVRTDLGEGNLIYNSKLISNAINQSGVNRLGETTGCSSGYEWVDQEYISALTEALVYGSTIWSSSGYDSGEAYRQLDVFKNFGFTEIFGSNDIWLRDIVSATKAAYLDNQGSANNDTASVTKNIAALILFH